MNAARINILYWLGIAIGAVGVIVTVAAMSSLVFRSAGVLLCVVGAGMVARFRVGTRRSSIRDSESAVRPVDTSRIRRVIMVLAAVSLVTSITFLALLFAVDSNSNYAVWLVYAFAVSAVVCSLLFAYIAGKFVGDIFRKMVARKRKDVE